MTIKLLPYHHMTFKLAISRSTALNRVDRHTHESRLGKSFNPLHKAFAGFVNEEGFKIRRSVEYQNSFSPIVLGSVLDDNDQCVVSIKMRMHYFVMGFMIVWLMGALAMTLGYFSLAISGTNALISFFIGYALMMHSFWKEAKRAKEELDIIFEEE